MLHDTYLHERLARAAGEPSKREIATRLAIAELRLRPGLARRAARRGGRLLIRAGAWLMAYGAGREARLRRSALRTHPSVTTCSRN
ncbi:hypothetical protein K2Z83_13785 [Oscillochloris sp. ZM17-4]|uniref:hypothetical protein n=1 Tax=Oscillochloris sp. ZM17-4 TaxID=2866714 RepID=UPI001C72AB66|nr:hypothetical protein [Oscillochloris sp. ZM17-4]MBX0328747.1 hypothetical protein [Oscillochloris sp. ZM17-4]